MVMAWFMDLVSTLIWYGWIVGMGWLESVGSITVVILSHSIHVSCCTILLHARNSANSRQEAGDCVG